MKVDMGRVLGIIEEGRSAHQWFIDHCLECNIFVGNVKHHKLWVANYNYLEKVIKKAQTNEVRK